jgi:predicted MPP superfamily phosphohydrolase
VLAGILIILLILNLPLSVFFYRPLDALLVYFPTRNMKNLFLPSLAWVMTLLFCSLTLAVLAVSTAIVFHTKKLFSGRSTEKSATVGEKHARIHSANELNKLNHWPARRRFITGSLGLALPAFYGVSAYGLSSGLDNLEISPQLPIAIPDLPSALDGFRIIQISDIHVGPYLRKRELEEIVVRVNALRPDVVVITGDLIDRDLGFLPETVSALRSLHSTFGTFMVLGNHDVAADPTNTGTRHRAGEHIAKAMSTVGIQTLRDQVAMVGEAHDQIALMGLDWIDPRRGPSYLYYDSPRTIRALKTMHHNIAPKTSKILLAHHPETFTDAIPFQIGLTLAGHTHGGGQVVL